MTTTGISNFTVTRDQVIQAALRTLQDLGAGETASAEDYTNCNQALNIMIKSWQKKGAALWLYQDITLPLVSGVTNYPIGPSAGYLATAGFTITDGGTGGTDGEYPLVITDTSGTLAVGTFTVAGGVISEIAITTAGSGYVAPTFDWSAAGITGEDVECRVVGVTTTRPLRVLDAFIRDDTTGADTPLSVIAFSEYNALGQKTASGTPNQLLFKPTLGNAEVSVYLVPSGNGQTIHLIAQRPICDMVSSGDTFDFPQEWFRALKWGLADELALEYGTGPETLQIVAQKAAVYLEECFDWSVEEASVYFTVDTAGRG